MSGFETKTIDYSSKLAESAVRDPLKPLISIRLRIMTGYQPRKIK
jgi:hypothetical protein